MSNAFTYRMPAGIPGAISRIQAATVEAQQLDTVNYPAAYGVPVAIDAASHNMRAIKAGDAAAGVIGLYVRPYPVTGGGNDPIGSATTPTFGIANVLRRGYMTVKLNGTAPAVKGGTVYVRTAVGTGSVIGGIEAAADSTNTFALPSNCYFMGAADANGNCEIGFNI